MHYYFYVILVAFKFDKFLLCSSMQNVFEMEIDSPEYESSPGSAEQHAVTNQREFAYASYFQDHMVLQAAPRKTVLWGYAPENSTSSEVHIKLDAAHIYVTTVDENLLWRVEIGPIEPGGPYNITATLDGTPIRLVDVLFGDVWVCSGQSNMYFPLTGIFNSTAEINDTQYYSRIRLFVVAYNRSHVPLADFGKNGSVLPWSKASPDVVRDSKFSAVCWLYGKYLYQYLKKPIGLIETSVGGTPIEAWSSADSLKKCGLKGKQSKLEDKAEPWENWSSEDYSVLWNAMVHPLINMTIFGTIWYQGESNAVQNRDLYNCTFPRMVDDWRKKFSTSSGTDQLFPFGFVQLGSYRPEYPIEIGFPDIRWHQTADYGYVPNHRLRNVFMAVAMDLPDFTSPFDSIHPRDKQDVASRLALSGLAVAYQQNFSYQGPYPVHVTLSKTEDPFNYTIVEVAYTMDIEQRWMDGFEICCSFVDPAVCESGKSWWLPTMTTQAADLANITQSYATECDLEKVVGIRYAWHESPCQFKSCAVYGADNGLPMPPFTYSGEAAFKRRVVSSRQVEVVLDVPGDYIIEEGLKPTSVLSAETLETTYSTEKKNANKAFIMDLDILESSLQTFHPDDLLIDTLYASQVRETQDRNFSFASYYGDHMVLQGSPRKAVVWGYVPGDMMSDHVLVILEPGSQTYSAEVTEELTWAVKIGPVEAGGPYNITAQYGDAVLTLEDVLFGDVWICSGQSNMQFSMSQVFNSSEELADTVNYPDLRVFVVNDKTSDTPLTDFPDDGITLPWSKPSPKTIGGGDFHYFSAVCWLYGKYLYQQLKKPLGLLETSWGGTPVEAWSSADALKKCGLKDLKQKSPSDLQLDLLRGPQEYMVLWNAMVNPLLNLSIYGAIWYQGENNAHLNMNLYNCTFPAMIDDWRKKFSSSGDTSQLFPFGFVQLAGNSPDYSVATGFPDIRWHQTADYGYAPNHRQRNVFMAVAMDLPDFTSPYGSVHPRDKQDVAARLVLGGLAVAYNQNISFQGPYPLRVIISHSEEPYNYTQIEIEYSMSLEQRWFDGFEICCAYQDPPRCEPGRSWWLPTATMKAYQQDNVTLSYAIECTMQNVVGVRYAWRESPCQFKACAIYGADNGLPMPPFIYSGEAFSGKLYGRKYVINIL